jgi:hypothetical protein
MLMLTDLFCCCCCNGGVPVLCRLPPTTLNGCSFCCCCFWTGCVVFLVKEVGNVWTCTLVCCLVDSNSSLDVDFGWVTGGTRIVIGFFALPSIEVVDDAGGGGVVVRVLFLLRLRAFDDVSTVWADAVNNSWY